MPRIYTFKKEFNEDNVGDSGVDYVLLEQPGINSEIIDSSPRGLAERCKSCDVEISKDDVLTTISKPCFDGRFFREPFTVGELRVFRQAYFSNKK